MDLTIKRATSDQAHFIARIVMGALGEELCYELAGPTKNLDDVSALFTDLARNPLSQYSYKNTLIACVESGAPIGGIVAYDGALLHRLRKAFVPAANRYLGWNITENSMAEWGDETGPEQIYIDSLFVEPSFRGKGVASALFNSVFQRYAHYCKPFGLLVEPENRTAQKLYEKLGFHRNGESNFFSTPMLKMTKNLR